MAPAAAAQQAEGGYSPTGGVRLGAPSPSLGAAPVYRWGQRDLQRVPSSILRRDRSRGPTCLPACPASSCLPAHLPCPPHLSGRPSAVPKGKAAVPVATDGKVGPSTLESKRALLERLHMTERCLEVSWGRAGQLLAGQLLTEQERAGQLRTSAGC